MKSFFLMGISFWITPFLYSPTFPGTQLGRKTRAGCCITRLTDNVQSLWNVKDQVITGIRRVTGSPVMSFDKNLMKKCLVNTSPDDCRRDCHCKISKRVAAWRQGSSAIQRTKQWPEHRQHTAFVYGQLRERRLGESLVRAPTLCLRARPQG
jgi:hypothetical protein